MRFLWWLFRFRRRARQTWRLLGREDPMTAVAVKRVRDASDLTNAELLDGISRARAEALEYLGLGEPEPAGMRMDLANVLLDEWAARRESA